jgi:hypothetical protein
MDGFLEVKKRCRAKERLEADDVRMEPGGGVKAR